MKLHKARARIEVAFDSALVAANFGLIVHLGKTRRFDWLGIIIQLEKERY